MFVDAKLDGGGKIANNAIHIQDVCTETVLARGSATVSLVGVACYVTKVKKNWYIFQNFKVKFSRFCRKLTEKSAPD